jgi:hypothetical protein
MLPKLLGVYPLARRYASPHAVFTTLLMSTGLTFGTITSLYGLNAGIIDRTQFSLLIAVVVLSAIVPTAIARRFYSPSAIEQHDLTAPVAPAGVLRSAKGRDDLCRDGRDAEVDRPGEAERRRGVSAVRPARARQGEQRRWRDTCSIPAASAARA